MNKNDILKMLSDDGNNPIVEQAILRRKMIRDSFIVRAESKHFSLDNGFSTHPEVKMHNPKPLRNDLPRLAKGRNVIWLGRTVYLA